MGQSESKFIVQTDTPKATLLVTILQKYVEFKNVLPHDYKYMEIVNYMFTFLIKRCTFEDKLKNSLLGYQEDYQPFKSFVENGDIPDMCYYRDIEENYNNIFDERLGENMTMDLFYLLNLIRKVYIKTRQFTIYDNDRLKSVLDTINVNMNFSYPYNSLRWAELKHIVIKHFIEYPEKHKEIEAIIVSLELL